MSNAHKVVLGITKDDLHRAAQAIADAVDAAGDSGSQSVDRMDVERATQVWLVDVIELLLVGAAHYALDADSPWRGMLHDRLIAELDRTRKLQR